MKPLDDVIARIVDVAHPDRIGIPVPVDVIVVTPEDVELYRDGVATIIGPALREGREVYAA